MLFWPILRNFSKTIKIRARTVLKPTIKIGDQSFLLTLDVREFDRDEISVKAHPNYIAIEGKNERRTADGLVIKRFVKKYRLPNNCQIEKTESRYSSDGILTISVPRILDDPDKCISVIVPVDQDVKNRREKIKSREKIAYPKVVPLCPSTIKKKDKKD